MGNKFTIGFISRVYGLLRRGIGFRRFVSDISGRAYQQLVSKVITASYADMAADVSHEHEAERWIEGLISDVATDLNGP